MSNLKLKTGTFAQCSHCLHWFEAKDNPLKQVGKNWLCRECCFLFDTSDDQAVIKRMLAEDAATIKKMIEKVRNGSDESENQALIDRILADDKATIKKLMEDNRQNG